MGREIFNLQNAAIDSFLEKETYFSTLLKRPADPEKTEKGELIVYVVCFITQTAYNVLIFNYLDVVEFCISLGLVFLFPARL